MRVEQACRFRADGGYRIVAQSSGVGHGEERAIELFSDTVAPLFDGFSDKVVSCLVRGGMFVTAQTAASSDAYGRGAIFAHGLFIASTAYVDALRCDPAGTIGWLYEHACSPTNQTGELPTLEYEPAGDENSLLVFCRDVREKAGLVEDDVYARFLNEVVCAILFGGSVCIEKNPDETPDQPDVLAWAACAAFGLPRRLLASLTWSTAFDSRASLCVAGPQRVGTGRLCRFDADVCKPSPSLSRNHDGIMPFIAVAQMDDQARPAYLCEVDGWLDKLVPGSSLPSLQALYCAMLLARLETLEREEIYELLRMLLVFSQEPAGAVLEIESVATNVLRRLSDTSTIPDDLLVELARFAVKQGEGEFADIMCETLESAGLDSCRRILSTLINEATSSKDTHVIGCLIQRLGDDALFADSELGEMIVLWCMRNGAGQWTTLCREYSDRCPLVMLPTLVGDVIQGVHESTLNPCEIAFVGESLHRMLVEDDASQVPALPLGVSESLFAHYEELPEQAQADCVSVYLGVVLRPGNGTPQERLASIGKRLAGQASSRFDAAVVRALDESGCKADPSLWQEYCAGYVREMKTLRDVAALCSSKNTFLDFDGQFEQAVIRVLIPMLERTDENNCNLGEWPTWSGWLRERTRYIGQLNVSEKTRKTLNREFEAWFWRVVPLREVIQDDNLLNVANALSNCHIARMEMCKRVAYAWLCLRNDRYNIQPMEQIIVSDPVFTEDAVREVIATIPFMLADLAHAGHFSWDLAFMPFVGKDDRGRKILNAEGLVEMLSRLNDFMSLRIEPGERVPSRENSVLFDVVQKNAKDVKKAARGQTNRYVDALLSGLEVTKGKRGTHMAVAHSSTTPTSPTPAHMDDSPYSRPPKSGGFRWPFGKR